MFCKCRDLRIVTFTNVLQKQQTKLMQNSSGSHSRHTVNMLIMTVKHVKDCFYCPQILKLFY